MNYILISDAVKITGLDRQTIRNWIGKGIIPSQKINGTFYVDKDTFEALAEPMRDVENARKSLEALKDGYHKEKDVYYQMKDSVRNEHNVVRYLSVCVNSGIRTAFFNVMVKMLKDKNILKEKEAGILTDILNGEDYNDVAKKYECSRERVRQIAEKAIKKSTNLNCQDDAEILQAKDREIADLKDEIEVLRRMVYKQTVNKTEEGLTDAEKMLLRMDPYNFKELLSRELYYENISVRALNALICYKKDGVLMKVKTLGDLCQITREDIMQQRNVGKKTIDELTEYLEMNGLTWGMDIERVKEMRI